MAKKTVQHSSHVGNMIKVGSPRKSKKKKGGKKAIMEDVKKAIKAFNK